MIYSKLKIPENEEVTLLLGAGASIDANLPGTYDLTENIYNTLTEELYFSDAATIFGFIISGLIQKKTKQGFSPFEKVNIEEVVSAIKIISEREDLESSPFIANWHPFIEYIDKNRNYPGRQISSIIKKSFKDFSGGIKDSLKEITGKLRNNKNIDTFIDHHIDRRLNDAIRSMDYSFDELARILNNSLKNWESSANLFQKLYAVIHASLVEKLWIKESDRGIYLLPILDKKRYLDIFTLNYDNLLESILNEDKKLEYSDGFDEIDGQKILTLNFDQTKRIKFFKLHGSINWVEENQKVIQLTEKPDSDYIPLLIIGLRDKLRADGPFLDLLFEFKNSLLRKNHLVIIGYRFQDLHINKYIEIFLSKPESRIYLICGPNLDISKIPFLNVNIEKIENTKMYIKQFTGDLLHSV
ncbi:SIR2 family protein [Leptospira bandrabouensis]|uniref:SIR2 family protein n=1 Tax=Leptospira bandrabouensis TaxID=2484903 RepID=UPI001EEC0962|nr:SIR2 family protein [Leptospira bandrabouensis]MCG6154143.1 SIR2 family protein [Leptospira bandrabouensis]